MAAVRPKPLPQPAVPSSRPGAYDWLFRPVDIAGIVFFRCAFGAILIWEVCRFFTYGWIGDYYIEPKFHFTYYGLEWVRPWPGPGMQLHFVVLGVLAAMIMAGMAYRLAIVSFTAAFTYVFLLDRAHYLNHFYLICLLSFVMCFVSANRAFSLDAWRKPAWRSDWTPAWSLWLLRLQVAIPYVYGGLAKLNGDWLQGQPMQMRMAEMAHLRAYVPWFGEMWLALVFSYAGLLIDLLIVPLLLWRRTRYPAFALALLFHLLNAAMFQIGIFPWLMIAGTTLFLPPDWPRKLFRLPAAQKNSSPQSYGRWPLTPAQQWCTLALAVFFGVQLVLPLRHWLYPGNVDWTEEGSRFAWRMMLNEKPSALRYTLFDPATGRSQPVNPQQFLTPKQRDKLGYDPENLREFAALLKDLLRSQGLGRVEVRVYCLSSLNGRRPQLLVDPNIDLGSEPRTLAPKPWIRPLTEPLRDKPWLFPAKEWERRMAEPGSGDREEPRP